MVGTSFLLKGHATILLNFCGLGIYHNPPLKGFSGNLRAIVNFRSKVHYRTIRISVEWNGLSTYLFEIKKSHDRDHK